MRHLAGKERLFCPGGKVGVASGEKNGTGAGLGNQIEERMICAEEDNQRFAGDCRSLYHAGRRNRCGLRTLFIHLDDGVLAYVA